MEFEEREVRLPRGKLRYHQGGRGAPLLYFHSAGGFRASAALKTLMETRTVYMPIVPGFDGTETADGIKSCTDLAELFAAFADSVIKDPCDVMGHSFGGRIAIWFAARYPEKVRLLVLEAPSGFRPAGSPPPRRDQAAMFAHPENLPASEKSAEATAQNRKMAERYHQASDMDEELVGQLGKIKAVTLILHGTKDGMIPEASANFIKSRIPISHLVFVYDAAHAIEVDQPALFASLTGDFLTRGQGFLVNPGSDKMEAVPA